MRPLRLSITGLRSYRKRVDIDFTEGNLLAIVGDTGAGKSSILEAITYALFKATTWSRRDHGQLIADGVQTMSVELEFRADGRVYTVHRANSRSNYPPPVNKLECLSDAGIPPLDGEDAVNAEIGRLVGMDYGGFTSAVVLPQGNFQQLLQATPAERTRILKGVFRLDEIDAVREHADWATHRANTLLFDLMGQRASLLPNPRATAEQAKRCGTGARDIETALKELQAEVEQHQNAAKDARNQKTKLAEPVTRLGKLPRNAAERLEALITSSETLEKERGKLVDQLGQQEARILELEGKLDAAGKAGLGLDSLRDSQSTLAGVTRDLANLQQERRKLAIESEAFAREEQAVAGLETGLPELEAGLSAATTAETRLGEELEAARDAYRKAEALLKELRTERYAIAAARSALAAERTELSGKEAERLDVKRKAAELEYRSLKADQELEAWLRQGAVAHAAHGLGPGDECPICRSKLQAGFQPPELVDESVARDTADRAKKSASDARAALTSLDDRLSDLRTRISVVDRELAARADAVKERQRDVLEPLLPGTSLDAEGAIQPLVDAGAEKKQELERAQRGRRDADAVLTAKRTEVKTRREQLIKRRRAQKDSEDEANRIETRCRQELRRLPATFRPAGKSLDVGQAKAKLETALKSLESVASELAETRGEMNRLTTAKGDVDRRQTEEVDSPRQEALRDAGLLRQRVDDLLSALDNEPSRRLPESVMLAEAAQWAAEIETSATGALSAATAAINTLELGASGSESKAAELLRKHEYQRLEDLKGAVIRAAVEALAAEREQRQAEAQFEQVADLDTRLTFGRDFIADVTELVRLLQDGQFIRHVIERRQRNLLAVASEILNSVTGSHYGFSEDFLIVDRTSGQPRAAKTLSGGECFLASLALALGLVEIAARAGGRLDALFLDEGFGSLDANSLDEAMSALERRAAGGRLVAVVSHIKAVAERIETVLRVTKTSSGSEVALVKGTERQELLEGEVEAGLLT